MHARSLLAILVGTLSLAACSGPAKPEALEQPQPQPGPPPTAPVAVSLETLQPNVSVHGFTPVAVYLDGADHRIGARFIHDQTKFVFDYLRIESAPQGMIWVNSYPTSDKGEPHTQEHLLLGKGNRGRHMASFQAMALTTSSAFTEQWFTAYHFHTIAAPETFWPVMGEQLGALLDPDYTDEEIRREVRNFGVDKDPKGTLRLEEKGTVYNEMVRSYEPADRIIYRKAVQLLYGEHHPLAYESGGYPDAIRTMTPADIRAFHAANYHLANMGMIGAFPSAMALPAVLDHAGEVLASATQRTGKVTTATELPKPAPQPITATAVDYPYSDASAPSPMLLAWPATRDYDLTERTLLDLFLVAFAGDETTPLYRHLIDSKTRELDLGASALYATQSGDQGHPVMIGIDGVHADKLDDATLAKVRAIVVAQLQHIASLPPGDPELVAFEERVKSRAIAMQRELSKFLDSPPGFGIRGTEGAWKFRVESLAGEPGFTKSLTLRPQLAAIDQILAGTANPWTARLAKWGLLETPYALVARPSPALRTALDRARDARNAAELARLQTQYGTPTAAATLKRYQADYDQQSAALEAAAAATPLPPLVASPPLTADDNLPYTQGTVGAVPVFKANLDSMQSERVTLAFSLANRVPERDQLYLAALPALLQSSGIVEGQTIIAADEMRDRIRKEILALDVDYTENSRTRRSELTIAGAGNTADEAKLAVGWMQRVLHAPDWRLENLPRLRDVVNQAETSARARMQGPEEYWAPAAEESWALQDWSVHMHTQSFLTQAHDLHRLRWQLLDPRDAGVTTEATAFLGSLATLQKLPRGQLVALASVLAGAPNAKAPPGAAKVLAAWRGLSAPAKLLAREAGKDLTVLVPELPDASLAMDWAYLCTEMATDLRFGAPAALERLAAVRAAVIGGEARLVEVGSPASHQAIAPSVLALVRSLHPSATMPAEPPRAFVRDRLADHDRTAAAAHYVGLFAPSTSSGVFLNRAPATAITDTSKAAVLDYLASNLYTGHGANSLFMKTWAAGLAYSNGVHPLPWDGLIEYYAERCPLLPQTMSFVVEQLEHATPDDNLARYAIAQSFTSRVAAPYEERALALAADLADGVSPDTVRAFREQILALASQPTLAAELFARLPAVYGKVMPGYGTASADSVQFVVGPAKQLAAYETYLRGVASKSTTLHRLYPRDFWVTAGAVAPK